jgi:hypothetical protein
VAHHFRNGIARYAIFRPPGCDYDGVSEPLRWCRKLFCSIGSDSNIEAPWYRWLESVELRKVVILGYLKLNEDSAADAIKQRAAAQTYHGRTSIAVLALLERNMGISWPYSRVDLVRIFCTP